MTATGRASSAERERREAPAVPEATALWRSATSCRASLDDLRKARSTRAGDLDADDYEGAPGATTRSRAADVLRQLKGAGPRAGSDITAVVVPACFAGPGWSGSWCSDGSPACS
ncbi:MAG: hypothetical protein U5R31_03630 [Acidimicrobiia bacterium]|nr:hypothetical protein [Acidimicrobiia bacterium]